MHANPGNLGVSRFLAAALAAAVLSACASGDPDPGADGGRWPPRNVLLVFDISGSMAAPIDPASAACPASSCPGVTCPSTCATRITEARTGIARALATHGASARFGLLTFPIDITCGAPSRLRVDLPTHTADTTVFKQRAEEIRTEVLAIGTGGSPVGGGTPLGPTLDFMKTVPAMRDYLGPRYAIVITDGLPNCNPKNPNSCVNPAACMCTTSGCGSDPSAPFCKLGCLDRSIEGSLSELRRQGITTVVIGLGSEFNTPDAGAFLSSAAAAGGFTRTCSASSGCGTGNTCNTATSRCSSAHFLVGTATELEQALNQVLSGI